MELLRIAAQYVWMLVKIYASTPLTAFLGIVLIAEIAMSLVRRR